MTQIVVTLKPPPPKTAVLGVPKGAAEKPCFFNEFSLVKKQCPASNKWI